MFDLLPEDRVLVNPAEGIIVSRPKARRWLWDLTKKEWRRWKFSPHDPVEVVLTDHLGVEHVRSGTMEAIHSLVEILGTPPLIRVEVRKNAGYPVTKEGTGRPYRFSWEETLTRYERADLV